MTESLATLIGSARESHLAGRYDEALAGYASALESAREAEGPSAELLRWLGQVLCTRGEFKEGEALYSESLAVARAAGELENVAFALNSQGACLQVLGRLSEAEELFYEAQ